MSKISMLCQAFFLVSILTVWFDVYIGRCGSQRVSMMSQAQQLFTGSASKSVYFIGAVLLSRPCHGKLPCLRLLGFRWAILLDLLVGSKPCTFKTLNMFSGCYSQPVADSYIVFWSRLWWQVWCQW
jgi:hypothetical protein